MPLFGNSAESRDLAVALPHLIRASVGPIFHCPGSRGLRVIRRRIFWYPGNMVPLPVHAFFFLVWPLTLPRQPGGPAPAFFSLQQVVLLSLSGALLGAGHRPFSPPTLWDRHSIPYAELLNTAILSNHGPFPPTPVVDRSHSRDATPQPGRASATLRLGRPREHVPSLLFPYPQ